MKGAIFGIQPLLMATAAGSPARPLIPYLLYFLFISLVVAVVTSAIRSRNPRRIAADSTRFLLTIVVGVSLFSLVVYLVQVLLV